MTNSRSVRILLGTTAMTALMAAGVARAQEINAGGSTLASPTYLNAFPYYSGINPAADFADFYASSGSGAAQQAIITNQGNVLGGPVPFELGASDATANDANQIYANGVSSSSITGVTGTYPAYENPANTQGASVAGNLIIVPSIGTPITVPFNFAGVASNTKINLSDAQLCGIYSGAITTASDSALTGSGVPTSAGALSVIYRADGSGTSFLLTQHLAAVCAAGIGPSKVTFKATTSFGGLFTGGIPSNFHGYTGSPGVQLGVASTASSFGYLSPDYTQIIASPTLGTGVTKAPYVAEVKGIQPTVANTASALSAGVPVLDPTLNHPGGTATAFNPADPNSFVPVNANPTSGYAIVGYTTLWAVQCYATPGAAAAVRGFISSLYRTNPVEQLEEASGFTPVPTTTAGKITSAYLSTSGASYINDAGTGDCKNFAGR